MCNDGKETGNHVDSINKYSVLSGAHSGLASKNLIRFEFEFCINRDWAGALERTAGAHALICTRFF